ncbi:hypothetical protein NC651_023905 [Populus alba x Populus x berolinensis]|nr:hypothetical protein NC651_023905 [Populus alba x Populus x berolinensis]
MMENGFSSPRNDSFPSGLRVLVVDDDPTWLKILEKMLKKCSYEGILHVTSTNLIRSNLLSESISSCKFRMCEFHLCRLAHMLLKMWSNCKGLAHFWDFDLKVYKRLKLVKVIRRFIDVCSTCQLN